MSWRLTEDWEIWLAAADAFLRADPVANTVALSVAETLRRGGLSVVDPLFGWWAGPSGAEATLLLTDGFPLLLSAMPSRRAELLAETLTRRSLTGVNGEMTVARSFADAWERRTGEVASVGMRQRLYRLETLETPAPVAGKPRVAEPADLPLVTAWFEEFESESGAGGIAARLAEDRLTSAGVMLWEADGEPVSLAARTPTVAGMSRIGPVYTPHGSRRKGYGAAVTAELTRTALEAGTPHLVLFTDLADPTSNGVYQRIGYRPAGDRVVLSFAS